ncbi:MAG: hypothetical protein M0009_08070 [Deltaproteobacteria bacterium]|nr:hypothetical protein [Deltaproteobacteria bacterium]
MERFDQKGMILIPNPVARTAAAAKVLVIRELFCPAGHSLISRRALFNGSPGILVGVGFAGEKGLVALSPVYGDKTRIALDIDLPAKQIANLFCPTCGIDLPRYATCHCGADLAALFLDRRASFSDCIGICNRVDCVNAHFVAQGELISEAMLAAL